MGENMRTNEYYIKLGKKMCKILRHKPEQYGLVLDEYGWGNVSEILNALHKYAAWQDVTLEDIEETVRTDNKGRFELSQGCIRALYGHSFPVKILKPVAAPPEILYHGTSHKAAELILEGGLLPMGRQYVHLSPDIETAFKVGRRKDHDPVILKIDAARANEGGVVFYVGNDITWLADRVPPQYITVLKK
jgi:putative RNA 2'-phosphotransferase